MKYLSIIAFHIAFFLMQKKFSRSEYPLSAVTFKYSVMKLRLQMKEKNFDVLRKV